ncbi:MAG: hypothetical protein J6K04_13495 [Lachnospiraceae bacterium]|nr:hypothetical protein [Lachnospiraceae bacterium]MBP3570165.1 hypothetical protein [Lachnospiraceae bacterium]
MKKKLQQGISGMLFPILAVGILLFFLASVNNLDNGKREEGKEQLEQALKRCAVTCYATEGIYPPDVEYMKEHYGIQIDEERYLVRYEIFAENLMPDITVVEKRDEKK